MPRLFTALRLPEMAAQQLSFKRGGLAGARWIDAENYHITLSFVGDVDHASAREIMRALDELMLGPGFEVELDQLDCFGGDKPRSIFAHAKPVPELAALKQKSDGAMRRACVNFDRRKFVPHVTLARLRHAAAGEVADYLTHAALHPVRFTVSEMVLLSSRDSRGGGPYRVEQAYPFDDDDYDEDEWERPKLAAGDW